MEPSTDKTGEDRAATLVTRVHNGDPDTETTLVETYQRGLRYQLMRMCRDHTHVDDLAANTFRIVLEKARAGEIGRPEKLAGFIRRTARDLFIAEYQQKTGRDTNADLDAEPPPRSQRPDPRERLEREQEAATVRQVIASLSTERDRRILFRYYVAREDKATICADLEIDPGIFNRLLYRARQRFKVLWVALEEDFSN